MKSLKKYLLLLLCFAFVACAPSTKPTEVFDQFVVAYKSQDQVAMNLLTTTPLVLYRTSDGDDPISELSNKIYVKMLDFDYVVKEEKIEKKNAKIVVEITSFNFSKAIDKGVLELKNTIKDKLGDSSFDIDKTYLEAFKYIEDAEKDYKNTIEINFEQIDGQWVITNPKTLENAIGESYKEAIKNVEQGLKDLQ